MYLLSSPFWIFGMLQALIFFAVIYYHVFTNLEVFVYRVPEDGFNGTTHSWQNMNCHLYCYSSSHSTSAWCFSASNFLNSVSISRISLLRFLGGHIYANFLLVSANVVKNFCAFCSPLLNLSQPLLLLAWFTILKVQFLLPINFQFLSIFCCFCLYSWQ